MEDITTRAITIGVSVLIAVATISAVMTYYSTAQEAVRKVGSGTDIAGLYEQGIEDILLKSQVTGVEVKNLINYFESKSGAIINFSGTYFDENGSIQDASGTSVKYDFSATLGNSNPQYDIRNGLIPSAKYDISYNLKNGILNIDVSGGK